MIICTITAANYLAKANLLAQQIRRLMPQATFACCVLEKEWPAEDFDRWTDVAILARDLPIDGFEPFLFRHTLTEASTAIKARWLRYLFDRYPGEQHLLYLDPDIFIYSPFEELTAALERSDILVTPHQLEDEETPEATAENVFRTLTCGVFNLGFLALRRSAEALRFLAWWDRRLASFCYVDFPRGLFVDQRWVDFAMSFFDLGVFREPGYNVANWNVSRRRLQAGDDGAGAAVLVNGKPLRFFHFSGINKGSDLRLLRKYDQSGISLLLREEYKRKLREHGEERWGTQPWSYDYFASGEQVLLESRLACRKNPALFADGVDPFSLSNEAFLSIGY